MQKSSLKMAGDSGRFSVIELAVDDYDLDATLDSGQAFRWRRSGTAWEGVIGRRWARLERRRRGIRATVLKSELEDISWLTGYLQTGVDFKAVLKTFPDEPRMNAAVAHCRGLRLLRQEPWECLASFILSSTKQIVQIRRIVETLCERFGEEVPVPEGVAPLRTFPSAERLAALPVAALLDCKMGFRAPYLSGAAREVARNGIDLEALRGRTVDEARMELVRLPGVGPKIADCVLLFAYGFPEAFPIDVWVMRALRELYFPKRAPDMKRLRRFAFSHFGPNSGYAQQYLFHHVRTRSGNGGPSK